MTDKSHRVIGLMSGTSVDGIDAVLCSLYGEGRRIAWSILHHTHYPFPRSLRHAILELAGGRRPHAFCNQPHYASPLVLLDVWLGEVFARAALQCAVEAGIETRSIDLIASHGQTVGHFPSPVTVAGEPLRGTLQIGSGAIIAARTGVNVVCDFRAADMAEGGQGAPLVTYADWALFSLPAHVRIVQNLGGIGNLTFLPGTSLDEVIAFDTGPANMVLDGAMQKLCDQPFDRDGAIAARGAVSDPMLSWLLEHPYFQRPPPRSTGREEFGESYLSNVLTFASDRRISPEDVIATLTAAGAASAWDAYRRFLPRMPDEIILGGGGSLNLFVVEQYRKLSGRIPVRTHEDFGIPAQAKEALAFAILGRESLFGRPANVPSATGARRAAVLGCLYPGRGRVPERDR